MGIIHDHMIKLLRKFLMKYVQTAVISTNNVTDVPYLERSNQYEDDNIAVGRE